MQCQHNPGRKKQMPAEFLVKKGKKLQPAPTTIHQCVPNSDRISKETYDYRIIQECEQISNHNVSRKRFI